MSPGVAADRQEISYFRQISNMGLPFCIVLPDLFESLRRMLPFASGAFMEFEPDLLPHYQYVDWQNGKCLADTGDWLPLLREANPDAIKALDQAATTLPSHPSRGSGEPLRLDGCEPEGHAASRTLALKLSSSDSSGRSALLVLRRDAQDQAFDPGHLKRLQELAPLLSRAMVAPAEDSGSWVESGDQVMVILNEEGNVGHISARGAQFIQYALDRRWAPGRHWTPLDPDSLGETLMTYLRPGRGAPIESPADADDDRRWSNRWGRFGLRSNRLESLGRDGKPSFAVTVTRHVPLQLKLAKTLRRFPLSSKESAVCLKIALGRSFKEIAHEMRLSMSTVVAHSQAIYNKLGIAGRNELLTSLYRH
ncbi:helix-turn-helix transcriptional regulator [Methyloterricola oryzae]|uniref:helix-turn-helix transcriptional regulator n=1 Tax=Methyloterricola oryzae TaxID=1495050 RepID=UPI0005EBA0A8|nr:helix-turn-helix transcriptional regulator [Methyloterricola oryzae]